MKNPTNKYAKVALKTVENYAKTKNPKLAWEQAARDLIDSKTAQVKGCPKSAFLGLCEMGWVKGIPKGNYTRSKMNKDYAVTAVKILQNNKEHVFDAIELWDLSLTEPKSHNSQMDVVLALWDGGLIQ